MKLFKINRAFFGYVLAGVLMLFIFLYLRFPGDAVKNYLKASAASRYPELLFVLDSIGPTIPPGMALENLTIGFRGRPEATLHVNRLAFAPGWLSVIQGKVAAAATATLYGGEIKGSGELAKAFSLRGPFSSTVRFEGLRLEKCLLLQESLARQVSGTMKGSFAATGETGPLKNVAGKLEATLTNGSYQLLENVAGFDKIAFSRIDLKMEMKSGALKITNLTVNGDKLRITLKGNILLAADLQESRLDLTGSVELQGAGGRRMPMTIGGVWGNPTVKLM
ncbi:MAG: type II secretion system protein GspN [Syntrophales bacterium]|jgi:type II secretion system protein N|nr:type II secretion system protein GspN [Syntrophales bacterium]